MKTQILRRKPIRVAFEFSNIRRVKTAGEESVECRLVDGHSYVNAWVGDGYNLTREAMVAATDDYNRWGAVREMHQPSAVGRANGTVVIINESGAEETVTLGVTWDDKGAVCRSLVVDPTAMIKLDTGVYKAYSVGVAPTFMRGVDVLTCKWLENSLCDRPADPDALLTLVRADGAVDLDAELEVPQIVERSSFGEYIPKLQNWAVDGAVADACYTLMDCLWEAVRNGDTAIATQSIDEFADYLKGLFGEGGPGMSRAVTLLELARTRFTASGENADALSRVSTLTGDLQAALERATTAETERNALRAEVAEKAQKIQQLEAQPDAAQPVPVKTPTERTVAPFLQTDQPGSEETEALKKELEELKRTAPTLPTDQERATAVTRISRIRQRLQELGVAA